MKMFLVILGSLLSSSTLAGVDACTTIKLDDLEFSVDVKGALSVKASRYYSEKILIRNRIKLQKGRERVELVIQDTHGQSCKTIGFVLDAVKLCRTGTGGSSVEPWRFVTCPGNSINCYPTSYPNYSVVSLAASINTAKLSNARICGTSQLIGNVTVIDSIVGGSINL